FNNGGSPSINNWDVSKVGTMFQMFSGVTAFNQPLGKWNLSGITAQGSESIQNSLAAMFRGATAFDQDLSNWEKTLPQGLKDLTEPPKWIFTGTKLAASKKKWPESWR
ncbi:MAG: BspA family leucine-rich repeat surface protein, partial [Spirochaetota bacterium]